MDTMQEMTNTITVPGAPDIPGLSFRGYRDAADFEKMVAVIQGCKQVDHMERSDTAQDIERNYRYTPNFDLTKDILYVEMDVEIGTGFRGAESSDTTPVGTIPVDAIFTPIRKVNYVVEPTHLGRETSRERLRIDLWTDGTMQPVDAVSQAAGILIEQLTPFLEYVKISQMKEEERAIRLSIPDEKFNMPVEQLDLSVRTMNCLRRSNIATVGELIGKGTKELLKLRNFGQKSFQEIEDRLANIGLSLNPKTEDMGEEIPKEEDEAEGEEQPKAKIKKKSAVKEDAAEDEV